MGEYTWKHFNNIGIVTTKLSDEDLQPIKDEIKEIQNNFSKHNIYAASEKFVFVSSGLL